MLSRRSSARSVWFAFLVVWLPMAWLGVVSRFVRPRLPESWALLGRHFGPNAASRSRSP
jgi:hypothetical protein